MHESHEKKLFVAESGVERRLPTAIRVSPDEPRRRRDDLLASWQLRLNLPVTQRVQVAELR
jgi:hypothetical protein